MMRINYLLGLPTFLMIIGLAWASHSHANWSDSDYAYNELEEDDSGLPEVQSLLGPDANRSSFDLGSPKKGQVSAKQDQNVLELVKQFDSIQLELQELRGQIEIQNYELKMLKDQSLAETQKSTTPASNASLNSNSGLELNSSGITYKPSGT